MWRAASTVKGESDSLCSRSTSRTKYLHTIRAKAREPLAGQAVPGIQRCRGPRSFSATGPRFVLPLASRAASGRVGAVVTQQRRRTLSTPARDEPERGEPVDAGVGVLLPVRHRPVRRGFLVSPGM